MHAPLFFFDLFRMVLIPLGLKYLISLELPLFEPQAGETKSDLVYNFHYLRQDLLNSMFNTTPTKDGSNKNGPRSSRKQDFISKGLKTSYSA
mmetsp:Transcript_1173/g.1666  ORF Transcript_1173/g.1666 Transcript_1173/m.1666 type:complete len:92 (-) Transcript_1173:105-380(-)